MVDFEGEESVFLSFSAVWREKKFYGENRDNTCEIRRAGGCCSNREPPNQTGTVGMSTVEIILSHIFLYNWTA